jgi:translation initiation factor 6
VYQLTIAETSLVGALATGNNNVILLPDIIEDEELKEIEKLNIKYKVLKTRFTALGNNIIMNDKAALINPEFEDEVVEELKSLGLKVIKRKFLNIDSVGSLAALNQKGCLLHRDLSEKDQHFITSFLHLPADIGTINMGSPYIHSGIIPNSKGYVVGEETSGPEIMRLEQTLGFV